MIFGSHFIFDGIDSREFDVITCSFDGSQDESLPMGLGIEPITTELSDRIIDYGGKYNEVITFDFSITHGCGRMGEPFDRKEIRDITNWLSSKELKWLSFFDEDETEYWYFCRFTDIETKKLGGKTVGFNLEVTCDSPFAYSEIKTIKLWEVNITNSPKVKTFISNITINSDTDVPIHPNIFIEQHDLNDINRRIDITINNRLPNPPPSLDALDPLNIRSSLRLIGFPIDDTCVMVDSNNYVLCNCKIENDNLVPNYSTCYSGTIIDENERNLIELYNGENAIHICIAFDDYLTSSYASNGRMTFYMQYREKYRIGVF